MCSCGMLYFYEAKFQDKQGIPLGQQRLILSRRQLEHRRSFKG